MCVNKRFLFDMWPMFLNDVFVSDVIKNLDIAYR